ncbi:MAG: hypothetical protein L6R41_007649 [Letrouitia leprolyta]|nr:MAG: hypothetical protein L6R41_007649 [Letrouitia leprolyta]
MKERQNIYIIGAQSTGKTTLVTALMTYLEQLRTDPDERAIRPKVIREVARGVLQRHHYTAEDITSSKSRALELQRLILEAQCQAEEAAGRDWYISDRSGLDPLVYARRYVGVEDALALAQGSAWQYLQQKMKGGLVIVCEAGGDWLIDDGVRLMPQDRDSWLQMHMAFCEMLDELDIMYHVLPVSITSLSQRVDFVVSKWTSEDEVK